MRWRVVDSIRDVDEERWDSLANGEVTMTHRWHRVMEASLVAYRPRYLLAEDKHGPLVGIAADTNQSFGGSPWRDLLLRQLTLIVCAPFSSRHSGIITRPDASPDLVDRALRSMCWHERRPFVGVANVETADLPAWSARRFSARAQPPRMVLDLDVASYDLYLQRLAKRDRQEVRRARRRASEADVTVRQTSLNEAGMDLYPLLAEVSSRHRSVVFSPELFPAVARELADQVLVLCATVRGQTAGFVLCLRQGHSLLAVLAGLRYALSYPSSLYFVLIDELVRWSLEHGIKRVHAGLSNEVQKQRHGFRSQARWLCVRAYPDPLNWLCARPT